MKKAVSVLIVIIVTMSCLSASSDGMHILKTGISDYWYFKPHLGVYQLQTDYEYQWYYNDDHWGYAIDLSFNWPFCYSIEKDFSEPFNTFQDTISLDLSFKPAFRVGYFHYSIGPAISFDFMITHSKAVIAESLMGIEQSLLLDFPISKSVGMNIGLNTILDFTRTDYTKLNPIELINPRLETSFNIGLSIYFHNEHFKLGK